MKWKLTERLQKKLVINKRHLLLAKSSRYVADSSVYYWLPPTTYYDDLTEMLGTVALFSHIIVSRLYGVTLWCYFTFRNSCIYQEDSCVIFNPIRDRDRDTAGLSLSVLRLVINKGRLVHWAKSFRCVTDSSVYTSIYWRDWSNKEILPKVLLTASNDSLWWSNGDAYLGSLWFGRIC